MATTFDPHQGEVVAYLNGTMTPLALTDPVAQDVFQYKGKQAANPFSFRFPIFSLRAFVLKYNGYDMKEGGISEHRLHVDLDNRSLTYERDKPTAKTTPTFRLSFDIKRKGVSILSRPIELQGVHGQKAAIPADIRMMTSAEVWTRLETLQNGKWKQVGTVVKRKIREGAPFTFGRALGLGSEDLKHGSQLHLDGVAVFNRVLKRKELKKLNFNTNDSD
jgi:hypothetical protein